MVIQSLLSLSLFQTAADMNAIALLLLGAVSKAHR